MQRDAPVRGDDYFFILIDHLVVAGTVLLSNQCQWLSEALINSDMSRPKMDWDTIWEVRSQDDLGWKPSLPFLSKHSHDPDSDEWRIDFGRWFPAVRSAKWSVIRNRQWLSLEEAGQLTGLSELNRGKGIDFKPISPPSGFPRIRGG